MSIPIEEFSELFQIKMDIHKDIKRGIGYGL